MPNGLLGNIRFVKGKVNWATSGGANAGPGFFQGAGFDMSMKKVYSPPYVITQKEGGE